MEEIEERIRLKAGNVLEKQQPAISGQRSVVSSQSTVTESQPSTVSHKEPEPTGATEAKLGSSGMTAEQVDKLAREMQKQ